ncbi:MAG: porin family protein [Muribaculaceae bacterium]|nr:porin family protein [Muribaculaceae bacterium]
MKKIALTLLALVGLSIPSFAQSDIFNNENNRAYLGLRLGADISSTAGQNYDIYSNSVGFTLGAVYNIPMWQNLYIEPGLTFFYDTFGQELTTLGRSNHPEDINGSIRNIGFRIPVNVGYRFDFADNISLSLFTGPVVNLNATGKQHVGDYSQQLMGHGFKRADMQWDFGASMQFFHNYYIQVSGAVGLTKVFNTPAEQFRRNTVNLSLGYNF